MNELNITLLDSGETVTAYKYQAGASVGTPIALTEVSGGFYTGHMSGAAGDYYIVFRDSAGENVGFGYIRWDGSAEIQPAIPSEIPPTTSIAAEVRNDLTPELTQIGNIKAKTDALNTLRLAQCSTVETTGAQIAAALS